ncbi:MAG: hypothetical protein ACO1SX_20855 [Actinomycetota bacterium]
MRRREIGETETTRSFNVAMLRVYERARDECRYTATRFMQMVHERGGVQTAKDLLATREPSDGFIHLWERGRLDISMEAQIAYVSQWRTLFTEAEVAEAKRRLDEVGWSPAAAKKS